MMKPPARPDELDSKVLDAFVFESHVSDAMVLISIACLRSLSFFEICRFRLCFKPGKLDGSGGAHKTHDAASEGDNQQMSSQVSYEWISYERGM